MSPTSSNSPELAVLPRFCFAAVGWTILLTLVPGGALGSEPHMAALLGVAVLALVVIAQTLYAAVSALESYCLRWRK